MANGIPDLSGLQNRIRGILRNIQPSQFSDRAFIRVQTIITDFVNDLITESIVVSEKHSVDIVSEIHVDIARGYLISQRKKKFYDLLESLGGVFLGVALSGLYMVISPSPTKPVEVNIVIFTFVCGIIGILLIAIGYRH